MTQIVVELKQNGQIQDYVGLARQIGRTVKGYLKLKAIREAGKIVVDLKAGKIVLQIEVLESKLEYQLILWKSIRKKSARKKYNIQKDDFVPVLKNFLEMNSRSIVYNI